MATAAHHPHPGGLVDPSVLAWAIAKYSQRAGVPDRALRLQALLHLPRLADANGQVGTAGIVGEVARLAARLSQRIAPHREWMRMATDAPQRPQDLSLATDDATADVLLERFHYLGSVRRDGPRFVARTAGGQPAAVLTLGPCDLAWFRSALPSGVRLEETAMLSRVFAFDWIPRNSISYLLGALVARLDDVGWQRRLLMTYVNPNLGFDGASYRASNWTLIAREHGTRYAYLDGNYITDRALQRRFGTNNTDELGASLGARISFSKLALAPLDIYALAIDSRLRKRLHGREPADIERS